MLITSFESIRAIAQRVAPFLPMRLLLRDPYESWRYAARVGCPTLIVAASHDEIVPMGDTRELFAAFRPGRSADDGAPRRLLRRHLPDHRSPCLFGGTFPIIPDLALAAGAGLGLGLA